MKSNAGRLVKVHPCKLVLKQDAEKQIGNFNNNPTEIKEVHHENNESSSVTVINKGKNNIKT